MKGLKHKVAVVSGSYSGIGEAIAVRLAEDGARIVLANSNQPRGEEAAARICESGGDAVAIRLDLTDEASITALFAQAADAFGRIDILVNNAAITRGEIMQRDSAVHQMDREVWEKAFDVNTTGTMLMIKHALRHMLPAKEGAIINIGSGASQGGDVFRPAYAASKAAIDSLTRYVAAQYGKQGIRCNCVLPGMVITENAMDSHTDQSLALIERHALTPYLGKPEDIAGMVALLASAEGRFVTGQTISVDGGYLSHLPHVTDVYDAFAQTLKD